ncbi:MFS transporter [Paraburkholderia fungorum]|uniref:MFS transporter n=1 Tax=Paraburkholderia fungorum TaxID=134537 RepID=UPI0038B77D21
MQTALPTSTSQASPAFASPFRWIVLLFAWAALVLSTVCRLAYGTLAISVGQSLALPLAALGVFVTAFHVGYVLSNVVGGVTTDRIGGRAMLSISVLSLAAATFCFGYTTSLIVGLILQVIMGLTAGADYASGVKLVTQWFDRRERGRAIGLLMTASAIAVITTNALLPTIVEKFGWRDTYHGLGVVVLIFAIICAIVVRESPNSNDTVLPTLQHTKPRMSALFTRNFVLLGLAGCGAFWGTLGFSTWTISLMVKGHNISAVQAGFVLSIAGIAGLLSNPAVGWLSDRLGGRRRALTIASLGFFCVMLLVFGQLSNLTSLLIAAPLIGIGAFIAAPLLVTQVAEQGGPKMAGSAAGIANAVWQSGSALSPVVVGAAFQMSHSFSVAFSVLAIGPLFGLVCMLFIKEKEKPSGD